MSSGSHLSKEFFDLVKSIGESRSKQEEDRIIRSEVTTLKAKMGAKKITSKGMKELLIRMIYVEMLGHDASFGHIHAVKMVSTKNLLEKRIGYLALTLSLSADHHFMLLLINSIQLDLGSSNFLEVSMALTVVCKLVNQETIPAVMPLVTTLLKHKQANVRKKAIMCMHRFYQLDPNSCPDISEHVRKVLCDRDPAVMAASLTLFNELVELNASQYKDLVPSFVSILKQVTEHRLPRDFDYHRMPAPWIQLSLLRILALLGQADQRASEGMYEILHEVMKRADIGINIGYAIVYECVRTITTIYPSPKLIEDASLSVSRFISAGNHNLKYLGITSLAAIVQIDAKYAIDHQMTVIDCLEDPDETLKRKTLGLLYRMANPQNVTVIVSKLLQFLSATSDKYLRIELVDRITQISEKFAPSPSWYLQSMNSVFELGGDIVPQEVCNAVLVLLAESEEEEEEEEGDEESVRVFAVETYLEMLTEKKNISDTLLKVIAWVLGEYGNLSPSASSEDVIDILCDAMERPVEEMATRSWLLSAISKQTAALAGTTNDLHTALPRLQQVIDTCRVSVDVNLQQRAHELHELIASPSLLHAVLPLGNASAEIKIDESLPALQSYVEMALANGAKPFQSQTELDSFKSAHTDDTHESSYKRKSVKGLKFDAYENVTTLPEYNETKEVVNVPVMDAAKVTNATKGGLQLNNAASVWGPVVTKAPEPVPVAQVKAPEPVYTPTPVVAVSTPTVRTVAAVAAPRELTEKEKMAQSLFMGVTTTTKPRRGRRKVGQTASRTTPAAVKATPQPVAVTKSDDLFDMNFAAVSPTPTTTTASTDLASDIFSATPTTTAPAPSGGNDLDFFGMMTESTPATTTAAPVDDLDIFGMSSAPVAAAAVLVGEAAVSTELKNKLGALPRSDEQVFVDTDKLHVSGFTVFSPAATMMVLCVTNKSATAFGPNANAKLAFGPSFKVNVEFGESKLSSKLGTLTLFLSRLGAGQTKNPVIGLQCIDTKLIPKSVSGQITAFSQTSKFMMPLAASDLLRPLVITTPVFGSTWKKLSKAYEVKISVASSVTTGAEFMRRMSEVIQLHPIQTIKTENICAGMVIGYKQGVVLVHGKMQTTGKIIVLIRSMNLNFNKLLAGKIQATIA